MAKPPLSLHCAMQPEVESVVQVVSEIGNMQTLKHATESDVKQEMQNPSIVISQDSLKSSLPPPYNGRTSPMKQKSAEDTAHEDRTRFKRLKAWAQTPTTITLVAIVLAILKSGFLDCERAEPRASLEAEGGHALGDLYGAEEEPEFVHGAMPGLA